MASFESFETPRSNDDETVCVFMVFVVMWTELVWFLKN